MSTYCFVATCNAVVGSAASVILPKVGLEFVATACPIDIAPSLYVTPVQPDK